MRPGVTVAPAFPVPVHAASVASVLQTTPTGGNTTWPTSIALAEVAWRLAPASGQTDNMDG